MVNSFTLTTPTFDPIGLALHPKSALFNHSCQPNAFVRFDVPPQSDAEKFSPHGSISVYTLRPVAQDEELTISYVDTTIPMAKRQQELKERYFFDCSCDFCSQGLSPVLDGYRLDDDSSVQERQKVSKSLTKVQTLAEEYLEGVKATPGQEHQQVTGIRDAMRALAATRRWRLHRYPWPQLRKALFLGALDLEEWGHAFFQSAILLRKVYPLTIAENHHPVRLVEMWTFFKMCHTRLYTIRGPGARKDLEPLDTLCHVVLHELDGLLNVGGRAEGRLERLVVEALHRRQKEPSLYGNIEERVRNSSAAWAWLDQKIDDYLVEEEGIQIEGLG